MEIVIKAKKLYLIVLLFIFALSGNRLQCGLNCIAWSVYSGLYCPLVLSECLSAFGPNELLRLQSEENVNQGQSLGTSGLWALIKLAKVRLGNVQNTWGARGVPIKPQNKNSKGFLQVKFEMMLSGHCSCVSVSILNNK